jgi:hypothetical protein
LNLERSIVNFEKKLNRIDPVIGTRNKTGLSSWKGKQIIPLDDWIEKRNTPSVFEYFPDDFLVSTTFIPEIELQHKNEDTKIWYSDYLELMNYTKNENYGRAKCFNCLLDPGGDDPIFIGINKLISNGLGIQYPCQVVNRFQCPFERSANRKETSFDLDDLFRLRDLAFAVEISLAKARKDNSEIRVKNKEELFHALTDKETFTKILAQGAEGHEVGDDIKSYLRENRLYILDYFMRIKDLVNAEELRFY